MRILALVGSNRAGSVNQRLLALASVAIGCHGIHVDQVDLRRLDLPIYDGDLEDREGQPDGVAPLRAAIAAADGLLVVSPEYNHSIPPLLKNALDWVSHPIETQPFKGKPTVMMSAAARAWGGTRMLPHLRDVLGDLGCIVVPTSVAVPVAHEAFDAEGGLVNAATAGFLARAAAEFVAEVRLRATARPSKPAATAAR